MGVGGQRHAPAALPPEMTRYPLYRRLGRPQGRSVRVLKISPRPGFDPRIVQLVASRYTDYAVPAHRNGSSRYNNSNGYVKLEMNAIGKYTLSYAGYISANCMVQRVNRLFQKMPSLFAIWPTNNDLVLH